MSIYNCYLGHNCRYGDTLTICIYIYTYAIYVHVHIDIIHMQIRIHIHIIDTLTTTNTMSSINSQEIYLHVEVIYTYTVIYTTHWVPFCTHRWVANTLEPTWMPHYELEDYWLVVGGSFHGDSW